MSATSVAVACLLGSTVALLGLGGVVGLLAGSRRLAPLLAFGPAVLASASGMVAAILVLATEGPHGLALIPLTGGLEPAYLLDPLSALYLLAASLVGLAASAFAAGAAAAPGSGASTPPATGHESAAHCGLLLALDLLWLAADPWSFALAFQLLLAASLGLARARRDPGSRAGRGPVALEPLAGALVIGAMLLLRAAYRTHRFEAWALASGQLSPEVQAAGSLLLLVGFGFCMGLVPFQGRGAASQEGSPPGCGALLQASPLLAGSYGLVRAGFDWLGIAQPGFLDPAWFVLPLFLAGSATMLLSLLSALREPDLARLLGHFGSAWAGCSLLPLAAALGFAADGHLASAGYALTAFLFLVLNGAVIAAAASLAASWLTLASGETHLGRLGGLGSRVPWIGASLLLAGAALAELPPLNGFVALWLTFQTTVAALQDLPHLMRLGAGMGLLSLAAGWCLGVTCLGRLLAGTLLGSPRGARIRPLRELRLVGASAILLATCLVGLGIFGGRAVAAVQHVASARLGARPAPARDNRPSLAGAQEPRPHPARARPEEFTRLSMPGLFAALAVTSLVPAAWLRLRRRPSRRVPRWEGGRAQDSSSQPGPSSVSEPLRGLLAPLLHPILGIEEEARLLEGHSPLFPRRIEFREVVRPRLAALGRLAAGLAPPAGEAPRRLEPLSPGGQVLVLLVLVAVLLVLLR